MDTAAARGNPYLHRCLCLRPAAGAPFAGCRATISALNNPQRYCYRIEVSRIHLGRPREKGCALNEIARWNPSPNGLGHLAGINTATARNSELACSSRP